MLNKSRRVNYITNKNYYSSSNKTYSFRFNYFAIYNNNTSNNNNNNKSNCNKDSNNKNIKIFISTTKNNFNNKSNSSFKTYNYLNKKEYLESNCFKNIPV